MNRSKWGRGGGLCHAFFKSGGATPCPSFSYPFVCGKNSTSFSPIIIIMIISHCMLISLASSMADHTNVFSIDIDECTSDDFKNCSQNCTNTEGSYQCSCYSGYAMDPSDSHTCQGTCIMSYCPNFLPY